MENYKSSFLGKGITLKELKESNKASTHNVELAETFNTFFSKIVPNLNIDNYLGDDVTNPNITDLVYYFNRYTG